MDAQRYQQISDLFGELADLDTREQQARLAEIQDPELRRDVQALLEQDRNPPAFLHAGANPFGAVGHPVTQDADSPTPVRVGRYRIVRLLGEGGMGVVYLAEQDHPRRFVALKVVRPDLFGRTLLRRFEREADILAQLQHPGIAQVYDAGVVEVHYTRGDQRDDAAERRPFLAMEYIEGDRLDAYVHRHGLGEKDRLSLIARVCDAVHHAHAKGVIHRDLKPANILVDSAGQPKVLDFGIARLIAPDAETTLLHTETGRLIGTLRYMSPEQVGGGRTSADTRADVYAVGVVLYELLAGKPPFDLHEATLPEALRLIQEREPPGLSTINRTCRGDIETIVSRAMEKDRALRYQSAAELAADIRRFLANEPILARPPSAMYQFRRFAWRHRGGVAAAAVAAVALLGGSGVSLWQAIRATRAQQAAVAARVEAEASMTIARQQAEQRRAVIEFLQDMLGAAGPDHMVGLPDLTVRQALELASAQLDDSATAQHPAVEAAVRTTIGNVYRSLGDYPSAEPQLRRAVELARTLGAGAEDELAYGLNKLARLLQEKGQFAEAEGLYREALAIRRELYGNRHAEVAVLLNNLGWLMAQKGDSRQAERLLREALALRRQVLPSPHVDIANSLNNLGLALHLAGDAAQAVRLLQESLDMDVQLRGESHVNVLTTMSNLAQARIELGETAAAEETLEKVLRLRRERLGDDHPQVALDLNNLALSVRKRGALDEAETMFREALRINRDVHGDVHLSVATNLNNLGLLAFDRGRWEEAEASHRQALSIQTTLLGPSHPGTVSSMHHLGLVLVQGNRLEEARPMLNQGAELARKVFRPRDPRLGAVLFAYGDCLLKLGESGQAEAAFQEALEALTAAHGAASPQAAQAQASLTLARRRASRPQGTSDGNW